MGLGQPLVTVEADAAGGPAGVDARLEQGLVGVNVADAHHHMMVHNERFHRG